jgi:AcrR family transcriptional regulator
LSGKTKSDRINSRRQATIDEIVAAAWELSRVHGLGNFSMRELGERVGMRAQSLYSYFSSKHALVDAMFADANRAFVESIRAPVGDATTGDDGVAAIEATARRFFHFCVSDPIRYQLLFQRTIPDFVPSEASFALAEEAYDLGLAPLREIGITDEGLDLVTAVMSGLVAQQISNDPEGDRWEQLIGRAVVMLLRELAPDVVGDEPHHTRRAS